jgi:DNA-binding CsgD family transcriptional regulator
MPYYQWHSMVYRATRATLDGRFADGEQLAREALRFGQRAEAPNAQQVFALQRVLLRWSQGRLDEEAAVIEQEAALYPALPVWRCLQALLAAEQGRAAEARALVEQLAGADGRGHFAGLPRDVFWLCNMALLSETCARLGEAGHAGDLYHLLAPHAPLNVMAGRAACLGVVARYLGLLAATRGAWSVAARHYEDALAAHARMGALPLLAHTQRDYAAMLAARIANGDGGAASARAGWAGQARELLEAAHVTAARLDMAALTQAIERLRAHSAIKAVLPAYPGRLTAREAAVLRLLAGGRSNPEIAAELSISVKTVERHAVNIYAKIGARNRVDAAAWALRHGLQ